MSEGTPPPRRKRRRVTLTPQRIADAAFALVDAEGVAALSARRLAKDLDCEAMSLYYHLPGMEAVLDQVVDLLLAKCPLPPPDPARHRQRLAESARAFLALAEKHPRVFVLAASRRWVTPAAYALAQSSVLMFQAAGAAPRAALRCARILGAYLGGAGTALAGWALAQPTLDPVSQPALDRAAPGLRRQSTAGNVRRDVLQGVAIVIDALLARIDQ